MFVESGVSLRGQGYSVRSDGWRYTLWVEWNGALLKPLWDSVQGVSNTPIPLHQSSHAPIQWRCRVLMPMETGQINCWFCL